MFEKSRDVAILNSLIETTLDSVDGYRRSAEEVTNQRFRSMFLDRAEERQQVVGQLQQQVRQLGGAPEDDGSVLAAAHRTFLSLRDRLTGADDKAVLDEVDRGESFLDDKWQAALRSEGLSAETSALLERCYGSVRSGRQQWETINKSMEGSR
jgi:uncharacterized protein (TIGR02284 family)